MADLTAKQLLQQAIAAVRKKDIDAGRKLIQASIRKDPNDETAWLIYASIAENQRNKLVCLKKVLELNPRNKQALKMVIDMGIDPRKLISVPAEKPKPATPPPVESQGNIFTADITEADKVAKPRPKPAAPPPVDDDDDDLRSGLGTDKDDELAALEAEFDDLDDDDDINPIDALEAELEAEEDDDELAALEAELEAKEPEKPKEVPIPKPPPRPSNYQERLALAADEAEQVAGLYLQPRNPPDGITWVKKEENRAGENEMAMVRAAATAGIFVSVIIPIMVLGTIVFTSPLVQRDERVNYLVEPTKTATPLTTPTASPGFTPTDTSTPSPIPDGFVGPATATPSPSPSFREGYLDNITPTEFVLPGVVERAARDSAQLILDGDVDTAIATLQADREGRGEQSIDANVYYLEALALADKGDLDAALELLDEGDQRRIQVAPSNTAYEAALQAGIAAVRLELGRAELERGNPGGASTHFGIVESAARRAIELEPQWAEPYLALAERYRLTQSYDQAIAVIDEARLQNDLETDTRFIVMRGEIFFAQSDYTNAAYDAYLALYAEPNNGPAHDLRTRLALLTDDTAAASIYAQTYIFYHPNLVSGWTMLGETRLRENNIPLALLAFTEAIARGEYVNGQPPAVDAYIARADIYEARGQYDLAYADIGKAIAANDDDDLKERHLRLAVESGQSVETLRQLVETYREDNDVPLGVANLALAQAIANKDTLTDIDYDELVRLMREGQSSAPIESQPEVNTLLALGFLGTGDLDNAIATINLALNGGGETAQRRLIRAQIYEQQEQFANAAMEYERVLTIDQLFAVPDAIREEARTGLRRAEDGAARVIASATATAQAQ